MKNNSPNCAACPFQAAERVCKREGGKHPDNCPTVTGKILSSLVLQEYASEEVLNFAQQASLQEKEGYCNRELGYEKLRPIKPRIEEIFDFIGRMKYNKIGMAFCIGLRKEAAMVAKLFDARGLEMVSAVCKVGRVGKELIGIADVDQIAMEGSETMCNPTSRNSQPGRDRF